MYKILIDFGSDIFFQCSIYLCCLHSRVYIFGPYSCYTFLNLQLLLIQTYTYLQTIQILRLLLRCKLGIVSHPLRVRDTKDRLTLTLRYEGPSHTHSEIQRTISHSLWDTKDCLTLTLRYKGPSHTHSEIQRTISHSLWDAKDHLTFTWS